MVTEEFVAQTVKHEALVAELFELIIDIYNSKGRTQKARYMHDVAQCYFDHGVNRARPEESIEELIDDIQKVFSVSAGVLRRAVR